MGPEGPQNTLHDCLGVVFWGPKGPKTPSTIVWRLHFGARKAPNTFFSIIRFLLYFGLGRAESAAMAGAQRATSLARGLSAQGPDFNRFQYGFNMVLISFNKF